MMLIKIDSLILSHKTYDLSDGSLKLTADPVTGYYSAEAFLDDIETIVRYDPVRIYLVDQD